MILEVGYPYSLYFKNAYLVINNEPRRNVILFNNDLDRTTVSYARYKVAVFYGQFVPDDLVVDHIDNDTLNDCITNYQLLTTAQNNLKSVIQNESGRQMVRLQCGVCGNIFDIPRNNSYIGVPSRKRNFCSRSCSGKATTNPNLASPLILEYRLQHEYPVGIDLF